MSNITLRQNLGNTEPRSANVVVKGSGLSNIELDNNFNNINNTVEYNSGNIGKLFIEVSLAYTQANSAFSAANNVAPQIAPAYDAANTALSTAISAYNNSNTKFSSSGGVISGNVDVAGSVIIEGTLTVSGNVTTINANNLSIKDNMIYLNEGNGQNTNPDLGFAGGYNDGIYRHAGFFRDATDGIWKVFDQYVPEPDESIWIDTSNNTFRIADFQANNIYGYINASNVTSGIISVERLGSGTANANTYLRGDGTWSPSSRGGSSVTVSITPPNTPNQGDLWWDSSEGEGILRVYYIDDNSSQWVDATPSPSTIQVQQAIEQSVTATNIATGISSIAQFASDSANSALSTAQSAYDQANTANINAANASYLSTGTVQTARLGSGTANTNTYLAGDNSWKSFGASGATLSNDTSSSSIRYIGMSSVTTGAWTEAYVSNTKLYFTPNTGTLSATIFNSLSDKTLKDNIQTIDTSIDIINKLNPVSFSWIDNGKKSYGFIAQEVEKLIPEIVTDNSGIKSLEYDSIIPFLVKAVQELSKELEITKIELEEIKKNYGN